MDRTNGTSWGRAIRIGGSILAGILLLGIMEVVVPAPAGAHTNVHLCTGATSDGFSCSRQVTRGGSAAWTVHFAIWYEGVEYTSGTMRFYENDNVLSNLTMCTHRAGPRRGGLRVERAGSGQVTEYSPPTGVGVCNTRIVNYGIERYRLVFRGSNGPIAHSTITFRPLFT
jgi:hypothetical protein